MAKAFTSRNKDGRPRKLREVTHPRAGRRQARKILEQRLGRKLRKGELVHHRNGNPIDNRPSNLVATGGNKGHSRFHS